MHPFPPVAPTPGGRRQRRGLQVRRQPRRRWPLRLVLVAACTLALVAVPIALSPSVDTATTSSEAERALRADDPAGRSGTRASTPAADPAPSSPTTPTGPATVDPAPAAAAPTAPTMVDEIVTRTNAERATAGLPPLAVSSCAAEQASARTATLAAEDRFEHDPLEPILAACAARTVGENLALGYPTALAVVAGWMGSDGHRANILGDAYTQIGVGCATGPRGILCAQVFLG